MSKYLQLMTEAEEAKSYKQAQLILAELRRLQKRKQARG